MCVCVCVCVYMYIFVISFIFSDNRGFVLWQLRYLFDDPNRQPTWRKSYVSHLDMHDFLFVWGFHKYPSSSVHENIWK